LDLAGFGTLAILMDAERVNIAPAWSPDGQQTVFTQIGGTNLLLYLGDRQGQNPQQLTQKVSGNWDLIPAWSPDGTRVAYSSYRINRQNIFVVDVASGEITQLTDAEDVASPVWSLDGSTILYMNAQGELLQAGNLELHVMNADGTENHALGEGEVFQGGAAYAPSGGQAVYMSNETGTWHLYLLDVANDGAADATGTQLTDGESNNLFPVWRPVQ
ncbi:MAG: hypothetical protein GYB65_21840, partial [Chloroflexi bacterium]|nr:hypothetical protein [Chloroflexota bacterium]